MHEPKVIELVGVSAEVRREQGHQVAAFDDGELATDSAGRVGSTRGDCLHSAFGGVVRDLDVGVASAFTMV